MHKTWPTDNLLDDMAHEYAEALYPNWNFKKYGVKNPWAFRLAVKDALVITDDGDPLLDPEQLICELDWYMKDEVREAEGYLEDDEEAEDEAEVRMKAIESFVLEYIGNNDFSEEELETIHDPVILERIKDYILDEIHGTLRDTIHDAVDYAITGQYE